MRIVLPPGKSTGRALLACLVLSALSACGNDTAVTATASAPPSASPSAPPCVAPTPVSPVPRTLSGFSTANRQAITDQEAIHDYIDPVVHRYRERGGNGYAGVRVDVAGRSALISWKGEPPADVRSLVGTSRSCVHVALVAVPFSRADIERAYAAVAQAHEAGRVPGYSGLAPSKNFDSLEVGFTAADFAARNTDENRARFATAAGMPVTFVVVDPTDG